MSMNSSEEGDDDTGSVATDYSYVEAGSVDPEGLDKKDEEGETNIREVPEKIVPYLARRAYHIPGNSWFEDWFQYSMANNHQFFGLFCHYKFHPVTRLERIMVLLMSVGASLIVSNTFILYFLWKDGRDANAIALTLGDDLVPEVAYENYQLASLTLGALLVSLFNMSIWYIAACGCFEAGGRLESFHQATVLGTALLFLMLLGMIFLTVLLLLLSGTYVLDESLDTRHIFDVGFDAINVTVALSSFGSQSNTDKWTTWSKQLFLSMFVFDLVFATTLFSGILGCLPLFGPFLGGRPAEIEKKEKKRRRAARKKKQKSRKSGETRKSDQSGKSGKSRKSDKKSRKSGKSRKSDRSLQSIITDSSAQSFSSEDSPI